MTTKEKDEKLLAKRAEELLGEMTNADKRAALKFFDCSFDDLDEFDQMVLFAHLADRSKSLEELDSTRFDDLLGIVKGQ